MTDGKAKTQRRDTKQHFSADLPGVEVFNSSKVFGIYFGVEGNRAELSTCAAVTSTGSSKQPNHGVR